MGELGGSAVKSKSESAWDQQGVIKCRRRLLIESDLIAILRRNPGENTDGP